ncbi:MAG: D-tyrosyl-tRNA(Tyr) deacylase [Oscillospiraceae bacterium]|jgi:D-tyrosyl-tRNA(Tyr) deacylase|nr:D-tyrosyl-tRNA(Tyr) deacylase [Oscillospiraceae bacterium]
MKAVIQRVQFAKVIVEGKTVGEIKQGFLVLLGVGKEDTKKDADYLVRKICNMRIFSDENDKINLSLNDINGELLIISQFTLYADTEKGNRPSFVNAASPTLAEELYEYFISECAKIIPIVQKGIFGADMKVELLNDGPFTITMDSKC